MYERLNQLLSAEEIVLVAASPLVTEALKDKESQTVTLQRRRGQPQVADLKLKISRDTPSGRQISSCTQYLTLC